jgi:hypothetical protein
MANIDAGNKPGDVVKAAETPAVAGTKEIQNPKMTAGIEARSAAEIYTIRKSSRWNWQ